MTGDSLSSEVTGPVSTGTQASCLRVLSTEQGSGMGEASLYSLAPAQEMRAGLLSGSRGKAGSPVCAARERMVPGPIPPREPFCWESPAFLTCPMQLTLVTLTLLSTTLTSGSSSVKQTLKTLLRGCCEPTDRKHLERRGVVLDL